LPENDRCDAGRETRVVGIPDEHTRDVGDEIAQAQES
jgi:hypothetical protein